MIARVLVEKSEGDISLCLGRSIWASHTSSQRLFTWILWQVDSWFRRHELLPGCHFYGPQKV